jgi:hypothetical protein
MANMLDDRHKTIRFLAMYTYYYVRASSSHK